MTILDGSARAQTAPSTGYAGHFAGRNQSQGRGRSTASADLPQATIWLNVGYLMQGAGKDGEDVFVSLPVGLAIDTMQEVSESANNPEFANLQQARNALLRQLIDGSAELQPGEARITDALQVEIRRVKDKAGVDPAQNSLIAPISLFGSAA